MWVVAAFMPFVLWRLLPMAEGASVAHGVRGAPFRSGHMGASAATMPVSNPATEALRAGGQAAKGAKRSERTLRPPPGPGRPARVDRGRVLRAGDGVPKDEIAFVHDPRNEEARAKLFAACRDGRIAVLVGSTEKMGVGRPTPARCEP